MLSHILHSDSNKKKHHYLSAVIAQKLEVFFDLKILKNGLLFSILGFLLISPVLLYAMNTTPVSLKNDAPAISFASSKIQPLSVYETAIQKNSLFGNVSTSSGATVTKTNIAELIKDYRLKGVITGADPEAIIEDARTQKSMFVKKGDSLGEVQVKEIREGVVVFQSGDEEKEARIV
jgi:hypothetical protein